MLCLNAMRSARGSVAHHRTCSVVHLVVCSLLLSSSVSALLMYERVTGEDACLAAMCRADSGCVKHGCALDQFDRIGCGYFRLNIYQFRLCYQPGKKEDEDEETAWVNCSHDYDCSANCIRSIGSRFRVKCYGKGDCEALARIHDGGANGCRSRETAFYWHKVKEECGRECLKTFRTR